MSRQVSFDRCHQGRKRLRLVKLEVPLSHSDGNLQTDGQSLYRELNRNFLHQQADWFSLGDNHDNNLNQGKSPEVFRRNGNYQPRDYIPLHS